MSQINFTLLLPVEKFKTRFTSIPSVQNTMSKLFAHRAGLKKNVFDFIEDESKDKLNLARDKKELDKLNARIPSLERELEGLEHEGLIEELSADLTRLKIRRDTLLKRLDKRDEADMVVDEMKYYNSRMYADGVDAWVEKLGNWFSEGHLGPGTVTYGDKSYTAQ